MLENHSNRKRMQSLLAVSLLWTAIWICFSASPGRLEASELKRLFQKAMVVPVPSLAPPADLVLSDLDNNLVRLADQKGKIVFLNFWTTWCPSCKVEMAAMEKLHQRFKDKEFIMLAVDLKESAQTVKRFADRFELSFPILLDQKGTAGLRYGIRSIPTTYIIDKKGAIIGKAIGPRDWAGRPAIDLFEHLITLPDKSP